MKRENVCECVCVRVRLGEQTKECVMFCACVSARVFEFMCVHVRVYEYELSRICILAS